MLIRGHRRQRTQAEVDVLAACGVPKLNPAADTTPAVINTLVETIALPSCPPRTEVVERRRRNLAGKDKAHQQQLKSFSFPRAAAPTAPAKAVEEAAAVAAPVAVAAAAPTPTPSTSSKTVRQGMLARVQRGTRRRSFLNAVWPDYQQLFLEQLWKEHRAGGACPADARAAMDIKRPWQMLATPSLTA